MARRITVEFKEPPVVWGHDLDAAYRQVPLRPSPHSYTILPTPHGATLWKHRATPFGAVAAVWSFNRVADAMVALARRLLCCLVMFRTLGLAMKTNKAQPPNRAQKVLGVIIRTEVENVTVGACPSRVSKMVGEIDRVLESNILTPQQAQRIAGKLAFVTSTFFGSMGKAALQPLYARGHGLGEQTNNKLTHALCSALQLLRYLVLNSKPRVIPSGLQPLVNIVVYTDAYYQTDRGALRQQPPSTWTSMQRPPQTNGWGLVIQFPGQTIFSHGCIPGQYLSRLTSRRAYIYMLEVLAVVITAVHFHDVLPNLQTYFIDNMAGKQAITKGYGRDPMVNALITAFWTMSAHKQWYPRLQYVKSALNLSDAVSRHDLSYAQAHNWHEVSLDVQPMLNYVVEFIDSGSTDIEALLHNLLLCIRHRAGWFGDARCGIEKGQSKPTVPKVPDIQEENQPARKSGKKKDRAAATERDVKQHRDA
eukprot:Skav200345  [mRNA]  locus=scaffold2819:30500:32006:- [translate_table: standard]